MLTAERLRALVEYCPQTGDFRWKVYRAPNAKAGDVAGVIAPDGYIQIYIDNRPYKAHRLAWLWMKGEWPSLTIDHRDTVRANNKWENLREASQAQNSANCGKRSINTSGYKGVCFDRSKRKWMAQIQIAGRCKHLGYHATPKDAHDAYATAANALHGEFARAS